MEIGRVALITGAAKRVGRAVALALADNGFDIAFTYLRSEDDAKDLAEAIRGKGRKCSAIKADLTSPAQAVPDIHREFQTSFGRLDVLMNNASIYEPGTLAQASLEQMHRLWAIHVESPLLLCQAFAPMLRAAGGHVLNMLDILAERPWQQYMAYCTSKAGLLNLTLSLARELAPEVTVNGIAPGVVAWPPGFPDNKKEEYLSRVPLRRAGTPQDVVNTVLFFCLTAPYVTGQIIRLDGGKSII